MDLRLCRNCIHVGATGWLTGVLLLTTVVSADTKPLEATYEGQKGEILLTEDAFTFTSRAGAGLSIPFSEIKVMEYGAARMRELPVWIAGPFKRKAHFLTLGFRQADGREAAAVFQLRGGAEELLLPALAARTGLEVRRHSGPETKEGAFRMRGTQALGRAQYSVLGLGDPPKLLGIPLPNPHAGCLVEVDGDPLPAEALARDRASLHTDLILTAAPHAVAFGCGDERYRLRRFEGKAGERYRIRAEQWAVVEPQSRRLTLNGAVLRVCDSANQCVDTGNAFHFHNARGGLLSHTLDLSPPEPSGVEPTTKAKVSLKGVFLRSITGTTETGWSVDARVAAAEEYRGAELISGDYVFEVVPYSDQTTKIFVNTGRTESARIYGAPSTLPLHAERNGDYEIASSGASARVHDKRKPDAN